MPKKCLCPGCIYNVFSGGFCKIHQYLKPQKEVRAPKDRGLFVRDATPVDDSYQEALNAWFIAREQEMTGTCINCGGKSCKGNPKYVRFSICHILPKSLFPSVATHPDNWIELCFFGKSCHTNMDNKILEMWEMDCWVTIVNKFMLIYPSIAANERKLIPDCLMQLLPE